MQAETRTYTDQQIDEAPATRLQYARALAGKGFHFAPARPGETHGKLGWNSDATTDFEKIRGWLSESGTQLVMVAKFGKCAALDMDDWQGCLEAGFDPKWIEGVFRVDTPSGGRHYYLPWDPAFDVFVGAKTDAFAPGDGLRPIAELKLDNASVAGPGSFRRASEDGRKPEGFYLPEGGKVIPCPDASALAQWLRSHGRPKKAPTYIGAGQKWDFHPDFDMDEFLESNESSLAEGDAKGFHEGSYDVVVAECPLCDKPARAHSTLTNFITKFKFGGQGYGFVCFACDVSSRWEFEEQMADHYPDWTPWDEPISRQDDDELLFADAKEVGLDVVMVANEQDPVVEAVADERAGEPNKGRPSEAGLAAAVDDGSVPSIRRDSSGIAVLDPRSRIRLPQDDYLMSRTAEKLGECLADKPLFIRNNEVVTLHDDRLEVVTPTSFRTLVEKFAVCYRLVQGEKDVYAVDMTMRESHARGLLASLQFRRSLREVKMLNRCRLPVWGDGAGLKLLPEGYDAESESLTISNVSYREDMPLGEAKKAMDDLFGEFVFADGGRSKAVAIAALVGMYASHLLPRGALRPSFVVTKNAEGAGATTLVNCVGVTILGEVLTGVKPADEDETRKLLTSAAREGRTLLLFDNQKAKLSSASLEAFIASPAWSDRLLGVSQTVSYPNLATVFVTSNGCTVSPDMRRRSLFVELHLEEERAEDRMFRRNLSWAALRSLRPQVLAACWSLVRSWHEAGRPGPRRSSSSFDDWARTIGGIVESAGFGCALETARAADTADEDGDAMRTLVEAMTPGKRYAFTEIVALCRENKCFDRLVGDGSDMMKKSDQITMGRLLGRYDRRAVGKRRFLIEGTKTHRKYRAEAAIRECGNVGEYISPEADEKVLSSTDGNTFPDIPIFPLPEMQPADLY